EPSADATATASADPAWVAATAAKAGIPVVAMRAYADAQLASPAGCGLGWTTLAGIGWVESQHGTLDGRTLGEDGVPSAPITGIPLGELDRAYGPLQFIPSTWSTWGADADGDGRADPQDIDDAALAAARYLCASGPLTTASAWSAAIFSYNHSAEYVTQVYAAAQAYAERTG
ncbi:MAG: lytic murein transglycosylase, partial [Nocardioides sp.]|uniref:lytic murein transglycosylase n=1 Tax=Nocardioides sp. TaxID=35761 RepID=UPI0039E297A9